MSIDRKGAGCEKAIYRDIPPKHPTDSCLELLPRHQRAHKKTTESYHGYSDNYTRSEMYFILPRGPYQPARALKYAQAFISLAFFMFNAVSSITLHPLIYISFVPIYTFPLFLKARPPHSHEYNR